MKISIITTSYNSEKTIAETLESVLSQKYTDYEHIIIDGNSKDSTMYIVKNYEKKYNGKLKYISEKDNGLYDAMNKGINMATGDIIGILNSDDKYANNSVLEKINSNLENSNYDGIYSDLLFLDNETMSKITRKWISKKGNVKFGWHPPHPTLYLKKEVYKKIGTFNLEYKVVADYDFMVRLLLNSNIKLLYIPEFFINMRSGGVSTAGLNGYIYNLKESYKVLRNNKIKFSVFICLIRIIKTFWQMLTAKFMINKEAL